MKKFILFFIVLAFAFVSSNLFGQAVTRPYEGAGGGDPYRVGPLGEKVAYMRSPLNDKKFPISVWCGNLLINEAGEGRVDINYKFLDNGLFKLKKKIKTNKVKQPQVGPFPFQLDDGTVGEAFVFVRSIYQVEIIIVVGDQEESYMFRPDMTIR